MGACRKAHCWACSGRCKDVWQCPWMERAMTSPVPASTATPCSLSSGQHCDHSSEQELWEAGCSSTSLWRQMEGGLCPSAQSSHSRGSRFKVQRPAHLLIPGDQQVSILLVGVDGSELVKVERSQIRHGPGLGLTRLSFLLLLVSGGRLVQASLMAQRSMRRRPVRLHHVGRQQAASCRRPTSYEHTMAETMQGRNMGGWQRAVCGLH